MSTSPPAAWTRRLVQLANKPAVRRFIIVTVGGALFLLGSAYLNLKRPSDIVVVKVLGGKAVRAGLPTTFRVVSNWADQQRGADVEVTDVRVDGTSRMASQSAGSPALVTVDIPPTAAENVALAFDIATENRSETLHLNLPVQRMAPAAALPDTRPALATTKRAHRVNVLPHAGVLAAGMENQVFVRVRDLAGAPLAGASVRVAHKSLPDGAIQTSTDGSGLMAFSVDARQPSFRFTFTVQHGGETTKFEELHVPLGRQMLLTLTPAVSRPETPITARLTTWRADAEVTCDLVQGDVHLWSGRFTAARGVANIPVGKWPEGRYSLQCSDHPWVFGEAFATAPVLVSDELPLQALLTELRDQQSLHPSGVVAPPGTNASLAAAYWHAILRDEPAEPSILLSTRKADVSSREAAHTARKTRLLVAIGLVFLLVLAWMVEMILKNALETRDRLRAYAAESFMDDEPVDVDGMAIGDIAQRETLLKTRGVLIALVFVGAIIGNAVGIIWLFAIIR